MSCAESSTAIRCPGQPREHRDDPLLAGDVQVGQRLVEQQQPRPADQGVRDHDPLLLAAGQLAHPRVGVPLRADGGRACRRPARGGPRDGSRMPSLCPSIPSATTSLTRSGMSGSMASFCGTYPIEGSRAGRGAPSMSTVPLVTGCRPRMTRSRVVLPAPFGPIRPVNSPGRIGEVRRPGGSPGRPAARRPRRSRSSSASITVRLTGARWRPCWSRPFAGPGPRPASTTGSRIQARHRLVDAHHRDAVGLRQRDERFGQRVRHLLIVEKHLHLVLREQAPLRRDVLGDGSVPFMMSACSAHGVMLSAPTACSM